MPKVEDLRELYAFMRETGALHVRCGELELTLPASPPRIVDVSPPPDLADEDEDRRSLEDLLYSSGVEAGPFLRAMKRTA